MDSTHNGRNRLLALMLLVGMTGLAAWLVFGHSGGNPDHLQEAALKAKDGGNSNVSGGDSASVGQPVEDFSASNDDRDVLGRRFNENDDLVGDPVVPAKPLPVVAAKGEVIGYVKDSKGESKPIRSTGGRVVPNTPGTYVAVDMWADGGPRIVSPQQERPLSPEEQRRLEAQQNLPRRSTQ